MSGDAIVVVAFVTQDGRWNDAEARTFSSSEDANELINDLLDRADVVGFRKETIQRDEFAQTDESFPE